MMSKETIDCIRRMSPDERLNMTLQMIRESTPYLFEGPTEMVDRRFELLRLQNDARNENMLRALSLTKGKL